MQVRDSAVPAGQAPVGTGSSPRGQLRPVMHLHTASPPVAPEPKKQTASTVQARAGGLVRVSRIGAG